MSVLLMLLVHEISLNCPKNNKECQKPVPGTMVTVSLTYTNVMNNNQNIVMYIQVNGRLNWIPEFVKSHNNIIKIFRAASFSYICTAIF